MRIIDYIVLGFRNIWRRKSRSFLTIFAVVIGAISMIIMLSLVIGAKHVATQQLESIDGLTLISVSPNPEVQNGNLLNTDTGEDQLNKINDSTVESLKQIPHVTDATPVMGVWVKSISLEGESKKYRANIVAYDTEAKVLKIPISVGVPLKEGDMAKIVIGSELLRNFGYESNPKDIIGKKVVLYPQEYVDWGALPPLPENGEEKGMDDAQRKTYNITAEIVGVITGGLDESQNYITLDWGKKLMVSVYWRMNESGKQQIEESRKQVEQGSNEEFEKQKSAYEKHLMEIDAGPLMGEMLNDWINEYKNNMSNKVQSVEFNFNYSSLMVIEKQDNLNRTGYGSVLLRVDSTDNIASVQKEISGRGFGVSTAKDMLDEIKKIFTLIGMIIGAIGGIVLFVAALGIINNMIMATYERTREIGVLRACGATRATIRNMFIFEAGMLGFLGGVIGLALSFALAKVLNFIGNQIALSNNVPINNLISFPLWLIVGVISLTTIIGIIAGLLPAVRAARLDPVEALRYE